MPFKPFIPDAKQWTDYFLDQVKGRGNGKQPAPSAGPIGGGISTHDGSTQLTAVGQVKGGNSHGQPKRVQLQITSPAEASLEQAESELKHIKADQDVISVIQQKGGKRKASQSGKKTNASVKRARAKNFQDVFSK